MEDISKQEKSTPDFPCSIIYPKSGVPYSVLVPYSSNILKKYISQNQLDNLCRNNNISSEKMELHQFTKDDYVRIVREKRREFVHSHFERILKELFDKLEEEANKMRNCHHEVTFECPEYFDVDKTESVLREYFKDIGFEAIATPRKDDVSTIIFTIT